MILLIAGASHTGKTMLAQRLLETRHYPYLSIDHLKMGLIRSGQTQLTPMSDDDALTEYLWPIVREIIKTAIENSQDLTVEGCYIPFNWAEDFPPGYLSQIQYCCLVMSETYIRTHFDSIRAHARDIEDRGEDESCTLNFLLEDNRDILRRCRLSGVSYFLIDDHYPTANELLSRFQFT